MKYTAPDYYRDFSCIASACPDTCCAGWQIVIDEEMKKQYEEYEGPFGNRLKNSIDWEEGIFLQYEQRCAFLNEENLCDIYTEAGPQYLCRTCRVYPRHIEVFENERELSLAVSCPVVCKMLLEKQEKTIFLEKADDKLESEFESFDFFLHSALQDSRKVLIETLQKRELSIEYRIAKVLCMAHDIQNRISAGNVFDIQNIVERYTREGADNALMRKLEQLKKTSITAEELVFNGTVKDGYAALFALLEELEVLKEAWPKSLKNWKDSLEAAKTNPLSASIKLSDVQMEQLMVYFVYTYYCGGVYDEDVLAKVKMAVVFVLLCNQMIRSEAYLHPDAEAEMIKEEVVRRFSRELEHSEDNLNKMEEMMNERMEAEFKTLLRLL